MEGKVTHADVAAVNLRKVTEFEKDRERGVRGHEFVDPALHPSIALTLYVHSSNSYNTSLH